MRKYIYTLVLLMGVVGYAYANDKVTALSENTTPISTDIMYLVDDPGGTPASQKVTATNLITKAHGLGNGMVEIAAGVMGIATDGTDYLAASRIDDTKGNGDTGYVWSADKSFDQFALLGTAATRDAEDAMTDGSNLPDGAAIKTYGDANWGGIPSGTQGDILYRNATGWQAYAGIFNVRAYGATGNGATNDTTAIQAAHDAATAGSTLYFPPGTYMSTQLNISTDVTIRAEGAILKRTNTSADHFMLYITANNVSIFDLTIDGNKAANATGINSITITSTCTELHIDNIICKNAKASGGYGNGLTLTGSLSADHYKILNSQFIDNDGSGISILCATNLQIENNIGNDNNIGISLNNYDLTLTQKITNAIVDGNICCNNNQHGIVVGNFLIDNVQSPKLYGFNNFVAQNTIISNNHCNNNTTYGIAAIGSQIKVTDNICNTNGTTMGAGILFICRYSECDGNLTSNNVCFGIDAGATSYSIISNNIAAYNGDITNGIGINLEGAVSTEISNNQLIDNGSTTAGIGIKVDKHGGDGAGSWFPDTTKDIVIKNNYIFMNSSRYGIKIKDGIDNIKVIDNSFSLSTLVIANINRSVLMVSDNAVVRDNKTQGLVNNDLLLTLSGNILVIPDVLEYGMTNSTTTINSLLLYSQNLIGSGIAWIDVTAGGSGYTSSTTVSFAGGGGSGATAIAVVYNGAIIGARITNYGTGYTSAPTVSFSIGTGATATAKWKLPLFAGKIFTLHTNLAQTLTWAGTPTIENPAKADISSPQHGMKKLRSRYTKWYLENTN